MEKINILMVDDQPSKLLTYEAILGNLGENLIKANSGQEALDCLLRTDIAVVLMDVRMPELDGFEVVEIIRSHPRFQKTAIIFVSADNLTDQDKLKGYRRGRSTIYPSRWIPRYYAPRSPSLLICIVSRASWTGSIANCTPCPAA